MPVSYSTCALDCPGACALEVSVANGRLEGIRGWPDHPFTRGIICSKVARFDELQNGPRVLEPLVRTGAKGDGRFRPACWDEALSVTTDALRLAIERYGPASVLPFYYGGTQGLVQSRAIERLARVMGFSLPRRTLCFANAKLGWTAGVGAMAGPDPLEVLESDLILLWGINAASTHLHFWDLSKGARKNGARIIAIDPYGTRTAKGADQHIALRPGTDGALACAMMQVLLADGLADRDYLAAHSDFDSDLEGHLATRTPEWAAPICAIAAGTIRELAHAYGRAQRPFIRVGIGMTRQRNGPVNAHAVSCLPAVVGAWPTRGAGALMGTDGAFDIDDSAVRLHDDYPDCPRILDMAQLGHCLTHQEVEPMVAALLVFNANPAVTCPDLERVRKGLLRDDLFTLVHEIVLTDTARFADVVLPATTFLEHPDLYRSYGQCTLQWAEPALPAAGQARCNHDTVNALASRLGVAHEAFTIDSVEMAERVLEASGLPGRAELAERHWVDLTPSEDSGHFRDGFPTTDGLFHFYPSWPHAEMPARPDHWPVNARDDAPADRFPLDFITPPAHDVLNSTFTQTAYAGARHEPPKLLLNPTDAAARGIVSGDRVHVTSPSGRLTLEAEITDAVQPGVCACESNHRGRAFPAGRSLNVLVADTRETIVPGPAYHDTRVEVTAARPA